MPSSTLSKSKILSGLQCAKRLWLEVHKPEAIPEDPARDARFEAGNVVGRVARSQWPDGTLADETSPATSRADTKRWLASPRRPLFEGWFEHDGVRVKPDVIVPNGDGTVDLYEVKSSTSVKAYHHSDVVVQSWVLRNAGLKLRRAHLTHIDNRFVYPGGGDYAGLFAHADLTGVAEQGAPGVERWVQDFKATLEGPEPEKAIGDHCRDPFACPFHAYCGVTSGPTNAKDPRVQAGRIDSNGIAASELAKLPWPRHYLDFETVAFAVPIWPGTRPYQAIGFQWSCHTEDEAGGITHTEFLAPPDDPAPWRAFAESLIERFEEPGPILIYTGYEVRILNATSELAPEYAGALDAIASRTVDLCKLARQSWYHPDMNGSWSIKKLFPTIGASESYDDLAEIADGGAASEGIIEYTDPATPAERRAVLAEALRDYCKLDTLAMVRVAAHLRSL